VKNLNYKSYIIFLFLLTAVSGIAMFIILWNNFLLGKEKSFLSLVFLFFFLAGLISIYFLLSRFLSFEKKNYQLQNNSPDKKETLKETEETKTIFGRDNSSGLLKGILNRSDTKTIAEKILKNLSTEFEITQGVFFILDSNTGKYSFAAAYAQNSDFLPHDFEPGEGITGQAAANMKITFIPNVPESYSPVISGLGIGKARCLYIIPLVYENMAIAVIEISCFKEIEENRMALLHQLMREGGLKLNSLFFADKNEKR